FGRHKLVPWLSPGKTWEGAAGAVFGSVLMAELGMWVWRWNAAGHGGPALHVHPFGPGGPAVHGETTLAAAPLTIAQAAVFGVLMAVFGHIGDLVESAIKRNVGTKDSAHVVPAFGGLLDILDSPLFAAPVALWFLAIWGR